jgi:AraC-like DNA-binding protein
VFPYRGVFVRHLGRNDAVGEANQALFFNPGQDYCVSHPVEGGDACLSLSVDEVVLRELTPRSRLVRHSEIEFRSQRLPVGTQCQSLASRLRYGLQTGLLNQLEAETLSLELIKSVVCDGQAPEDASSEGKRKLVDRAKLVLASNPQRRWTLGEIGRAVGCSPVYLTQLFRQIEGIPLYRYQMRLRLARALNLLPERNDLTMLALDLGFSSHSHFAASFRTTFGESPSAVRASLKKRFR